MMTSKKDMAGLIRDHRRLVGAGIAVSAYLLVSFTLFYIAPNTRLLSGFHGRGYAEQSALDAWACAGPIDIRLEAAYFATIFFLIPGSLVEGIAQSVFPGNSLIRFDQPIPILLISGLVFGAYGALVAAKKNRVAALALAALYLAAAFAFYFVATALAGWGCIG